MTISISGRRSQTDTWKTFKTNMQTKIKMISNIHILLKKKQSGDFKHSEIFTKYTDLLIDKNMECLVNSVLILKNALININI